jgi:hypothetical protein
MAMRLSALRAVPPGRFLVLISVRGWVDPRTKEQLEGIGELKKIQWPHRESNLWPSSLSHSASTNYATVCPMLQLLTYLRSWALLEKLPIMQPFKNFPAYYGTQRFITMFTRALHWSLSWARLMQSIPSHSISPGYILIKVGGCKLRWLENVKCVYGTWKWTDGGKRQRWMESVIKMTKVPKRTAKV